MSESKCLFGSWYLSVKVPLTYSYEKGGDFRGHGETVNDDYPCFTTGVAEGFGL